MALTENEKKHEKKEKPSTKVVIRRLPPTMDKNTFLDQVSPIPDYNYIYNVKGDSSLGENSFSRVYMNFHNLEDVISFKERFDNYVFVDTKGHEYPAVVEFAPFQKIPKRRGKGRMDPKCGTIESDPIYLEFLESLNQPIEEQDEKPEYTLQLSNENKNDVTTPLLEFIKNKRAQRMKIREVRREERKRKEFDRRKDRYEERRKPEDKYPSSSISFKSQIKNDDKIITDGSVECKEEKTEKTYEKTFYKSKKYDDRKYEDRKYDDRRKEVKPRYPKKSYENHDYKEKEYKSKYDEHKKDENTSYPKKVKKYSEKREERRLEAQKAEQRKTEQANESKLKEPSKQRPSAKTTTTKDSESVKLESNKPEIVKIEAVKDESVKDAYTESTKPIVGSIETENTCHEPPKAEKKCEKLEKEKFRESESQAQRRIRNKDRPTIAIYRPGMLSKRKQSENNDSTDKNNETSSENKN